MTRRIATYPDETSHSKATCRLRVVEMILCIVCIALGIFYWTSQTAFLTAAVVVLTTSFAFLVVTGMDVLASLRQRQYTAPAWVGIAFLATFMFFLSFGLLLHQAVFWHSLIALTFAITGIVFLIDGVLIIVQLFRSHIPPRVYPVLEVKEAVTENDKSEQIEIIEELHEQRKYEPLTAHRDKSTSRTSSKQFPITSYGGTFPVGEGDAAPLPTPNQLTGLESLSSHQNLSRTRRSTRDKSTDSHLLSTDNILETKHLYPVVEEIRITESKGTQVYLHPVGSNAEISSQKIISSAIPSPLSFKEPVYEQHNLHEKVDQLEKNFTEDERSNQFKEIKELEKTTSVSTCQTGPTGDLNRPSSTIVEPLDARYKQEKTPEDSQSCRCCATRAVNKAAEHDPRYQISPFITHHYNQTPCVCGYTHFQASTIIKGAVRQHLEDTAEQQQQMIRDQLNRMVNENMIYGCTCHDKQTQKRSVVEDLVTDVVKPDNGNSTLGSSKEQSGNEDVFYRSEATTPMNETGHNVPTILTSSPSDDGTSSRRVTIGSLDIVPSSEFRQKILTSGYTKWPKQTDAERNSMSQPRKSLLKNKNEGIDQNSRVVSNELVNRSLDILGGGSSGSIDMDPIERLEMINSAFMSYKLSDSKETLLNADIEKLSTLDEDIEETEYPEQTLVPELQKIEKKEASTFTILPEECRCCPCTRTETLRPETNLKQDKSSEPAELPLENSVDARRYPSTNFTARGSRDVYNGKRRTTLDELDASKKQTSSSTLPRILHPVEERRMKEGVNEDRISEVPPFYNGVLRNDQVRYSCNCPSKRYNSESPISSDARVYDPLNEKPYHPKDNYKMPENAFRSTKRNGKNSVSGPSARRDKSPDKSTETDIVIKCVLGSPQHQLESPSRREMQYREFLQNADRLRERLKSEEKLSQLKRGSLKRAHPEERK